MRNICSSPKYAAGGWNPVSVRLKGTMAIGRFNLIPRSGLEPTVRIDICESAVFNHCAIKVFCTLGNVHYRDGRDSCFADVGGIAERVAFSRYN